MPNPQNEGRRLAGHLIVGTAMALVAIKFHWDFVSAAVLGYFLILGDSFLRQHDPLRREENFRIAALLALFPISLLPTANLFIIWCTPATLDVRLRRIDLSLHLDGFALTRWYVQHGYPWILLWAVYSGLPLMLALTWVLWRSYRTLLTALIATVCCGPLYLMVPACGPQYAFPGWPYSDAKSITPTMSYRNCFPSMHLTWALILALHSRGPWRLLFWPYVAVMAIATVAGGEHYMVDIIAAVPFTLVINWAASRGFLAWERKRRLIYRPEIAA